MSSTKFPAGSIIINKSGERRKVLGACGKVRFISDATDHDSLGFSLTVKDIESFGYVEEAPQMNDVIDKPQMGHAFYHVSAYGAIELKAWQNSGSDTTLYMFGNCFPSYEAVQAARERVKKALKGE